MLEIVANSTLAGRNIPQKYLLQLSCHSGEGHEIVVLAWKVQRCHLLLRWSHQIQMQAPHWESQYLLTKTRSEKALMTKADGYCNRYLGWLLY